MRRIGRWMVNALTALSLLLCVVSVVGWVRSYLVFDIVTYLRYSPGRWHDQYYSAYWSKGDVGVAWGDNTRSELTQRLTYERLLPSNLHAGSPSSIVRFDARGVMVNRNPEFPRYCEVIVSSWVILAASAVLPTICWLGWGRSRRGRSPRRCRGCDYDLQGNVSGVCPEWGMKIGMKIAEAK